MRILTVLKTKLFLAPRLLLAVLLCSFATAAFADVSVTLGITHGYDFYYPNLDLSASSPTPITYDRVESPNGFIWKNFGTNNDGSDFFLTNSLTGLLNECNGSWKLYVNKGHASEQLYRFTVSITGVTTNILGDVTINYPADGSSGVTNQPTFQWTGPTNFPSVSVNAYFDGDNGNSYADNLPGTATNWTLSGPLSTGPNVFFAQYYSNNVTGFTFTTPTNTSSGALLPGWTTQGNLYSYKFSFFSVPTNTVVGGGGGNGGHTNIAHYTFDTASTNTFDLGLDSSPQNNNLSGYSYWGQPHTNSTDGVAGSRAVQFFGTSGIDANDQVLANLNSVLAGSFTFSAWVKTTASTGEDSDNAYFGATLFWAFNDHNNTNDTIPLAITGSKVAFTTRDHLGNYNTLHSTTSVNNGSYHMITVTRNQVSGEKKIYVDGNFETSEVGTTEPLNGNNYELTVGGTVYSSYTGLLDDFQIYSGVLSAGEVASLYSSPGTTIPDVVGSANGAIAYYDFDEGTPLASDVSGNGNNLLISGDFGGSGPATNSNHVAASGGSLSFDGGSYISAPTNLLSTIAGSFSISLWIKTTQDNGDPDDFAYNGDAIISADSPNFGANDLIPVALTGGQVAFNTANTEFNYDDTINSSTYVSDGNWHHVVVSRNQPTGEKFIYIDGVLDASDVDATNFLNDPKILTFGCKADASDPDQMSPSSTGSNGYDGLVDDIQIYDHALSSNEVAYLHNNPGTTLATLTITNTPYPVNANVNLYIARVRDNGSEYYDASISFNSVSPEPTTTNAIYSPHNYFITRTYPSGGDGSSAILSSLAEVINEITNGVWKIYINQGSPTQQVYSFQASASGINSNLIKPIFVFSLTNGAVNVATNPAFRWSGPSNFNTLVADLLNGPSIFPPAGTTNWLPAPTLNYGPQRFDLSYASNNFTGVMLTTPVSDATAMPIDGWNASVNLSSSAFTYFTVGAPAPLPVQLVNFAPTNGALRFSFQTLAGRPHTIQARTNFTLGTWADLTNFTGDGSLQQFTFPVTNPPIRFFRVRTQ